MDPTLRDHTAALFVSASADQLRSTKVAASISVAALTLAAGTGTAAATVGAVGSGLPTTPTCERVAARCEKDVSVSFQKK